VQIQSKLLQKWRRRRRRKDARLRRCQLMHV